MIILAVCFLIVVFLTGYVVGKSVAFGEDAKILLKWIEKEEKDNVTNNTN